MKTVAVVDKPPTPPAEEVVGSGGQDDWQARNHHESGHERAGPQVIVYTHSWIEAAAAHTSTVRGTCITARSSGRIHHRPCAWDSKLCSNQYVAISASKYHHLYLPEKKRIVAEFVKEAIAELFKIPGHYRPRKTCSALLKAPQSSARTSKPRFFFSVRRLLGSRQVVTQYRVS